MKFSFLFLCILSFQLSHACLHAFQHKIYPVGIIEEQVITIDISIQRTSQNEGARPLGIEVAEGSEHEPMWLLSASIANYTFQQKLISQKVYADCHSLGISYADSVEQLYARTLANLLDSLPELEQFALVEMTDCLAHKDCQFIGLKSDTTAGRKAFLLHDRREFEVFYTQDSSHLDFADSPYFDPALESYIIGTTRMYKLGDATLILAHVQTGHEVAVGMIYSEPEKSSEDNEISNRSRDKILDIEDEFFQEPLMHHGYGFDVFLVY